MDPTIIMAKVAELPLHHSLPIPLYLAMCLLYATFSPYCDSEKRRAYLLSTVSSATMSSLSLPFLYTYFRYGLAATFACAEDPQGLLNLSGKIGVIFFGVYLFADLSVGYFFYRSQVGLLTGWIHHTVYIGIMIYCLHSPQTPAFMIGCIMEVPTFDLAISNLFPSLRNDLRFLSSFFILRILFNLGFLVHCAMDRQATAGSWTPTIILSLSLVLHISWFRGGLTGYIRRRKAAKKALKVITSSPSTLAVPTVDHTGKVAVDTVDLDDGAPPTPEDSPLVTPYTPGTTPMSLRDSYLFPKSIIPTVNSLPTFSDLTAALPPLQLPLPLRPLDLPKDMHQFKDAVKLRWEESRERFGGLRGRGGLVGLGGLGLRRRAANQQETNPAVAVAS